MSESALPKSVTPRSAAIVAAASGVVAILAALLTPFLPVTAHGATISWPQGASSNVTAPLVTQTASSLTVTADCRALAGYSRQAAATTGGSLTLLATMPRGASKATESAMFVTATGDGVGVTVRGRQLVRADAAALARCERLVVSSSPTGVTARFVGTDLFGTAEATDVPQIAGLFSGVDGDVTGITARIVVDNRFDTSPSVLKLLVMIIGVVAALLSLLAVAALDILGGYHRRVGRLDMRRLLMPRFTDCVVTAVLVVWYFLGAGSSDDGYILNMGRVADGAGYLANYYRFHGIPEAPFDWYYSFLAHWSAVSTAGVWMRLPALLAGLASWFILSRVLLPRLGSAVRRSQWAMVTAAAVFVAFWMPFCSGLRSEPIIVLGSLLTWWGVEQAVATRRMLPAAGATLAACMTLATAPHGVIAVALLLSGSRPMLRNLRRRAGELAVFRNGRRIPVSGLVPLLAPIGAAAPVAVFVVFRDQTIANVAEAVRIRYSVGPTLAWYQEFLRFYYLTLTTTDGSLVRRVPVLLLFAGLFVTMAVMLRRKHIRGVDPQPVWRLIGAILLTVLLLSFTPTKWTVQFGIYAGVAAAMAAVATVAVAQSALRSRRNLWMYISVLMFACAVAVAGKNAWGWAYDFGIAWFDKAPVIVGVQLSSIFLVLTAVSLAAAMWFHLRIDVDDERGVVRDPDVTPTRRQIAVASSPMAVIAVAVVIIELVLFAKAAAVRGDTYTTFNANMRALGGNPCGMADQVLVESDPNAGALTPIGTEDVSRALAGKSSGFTPDGVAADLLPEPSSLGAGTINTSGDLARPFVVSGGPPGTTGGVGPVGVNGSRVALPFGLDPARTPVLGSYGHDNGTAELTSMPYALPERDSAPLLVISAAGPVRSVDADGVVTPGRNLQVEFGRVTDGRFEVIGGPHTPIDPGPNLPNRPWRNLRIPMSEVPAGATAVRIVARDDNLAADQWLAFTPPRAPQLKSLSEVVGTDDPVLLDLSVGSQFPCQRPVGIRDGVGEVPQWRIVPDQVTTNSKSKTWQATVNGGILTAVDGLTSSSTMATYLDGDWYRDWGGLQRLTPLVPDAQPAEVTGSESTVWGFTRGAAIRVVPADD